MGGENQVQKRYGKKKKSVTVGVGGQKNGRIFTCVRKLIFILLKMIKNPENHHSRTKYALFFNEKINIQ